MNAQLATYVRTTVYVLTMIAIAAGSRDLVGRPASHTKKGREGFVRGSTTSNVLPSFSCVHACVMRAYVRKPLSVRGGVELVASAGSNHRARHVHSMHFNRARSRSLISARYTKDFETPLRPGRGSLRSIRHINAARAPPCIIDHRPSSSRPAGNHG